MNNPLPNPAVHSSERSGIDTQHISTDEVYPEKFRLRRQGVPAKVPTHRRFYYRPVTSSGNKLGCPIHRSSIAMSGFIPQNAKVFFEHPNDAPRKTIRKIPLQTLPRTPPPTHTH